MTTRRAERALGNTQTMSAITSLEFRCRASASANPDCQSPLLSAANE
jgi:hypothetical protein